MRRRIRTRDESMDGIYPLVVFMLVWQRDPDILGDKNYSFGSQAEYLYYFNRIMFTLLLISDVIYPMISVLLILLFG